MSVRERDAAFAVFVERERVLLQRCAFLLVGRRAAADDLVSATLADLYGRWSATRTPLIAALRLLATTDPDGVRLVWDRRARFELLDSGGASEPVDRVVTDLGRLPADQRLALVLEQVARQPSVDIAAVMGTGVDQTLGLSHAARGALVAADPRRADDAVLAAELAEAVPPDLRANAHPDDLGHGQHLVRRRWARGLGVAAGLVVLVLALTQFVLPRAAPVAGPAPAVTVTTTPAAAVCDKTQAVCQASLVRAWRAQMYDVVGGYLDPTGTYFNGSSFYAADQTDYLWETQQGSLALEITRYNENPATEIYLQIATDRSYARRCGELTKTTCGLMIMQDGNRFTLSRSLDSRQGIEVQYRPEGKDVITIVARTVGRGTPTRIIDEAALVRLVQDENLRLPQF